MAQLGSIVAFGLMAAYALIVHGFDVPHAWFWQHTVDHTELLDVGIGMFKGLAFGIIITLGLFTSFGAAGIIGLMTVAMFTDHRGHVMLMMGAALMAFGIFVMRKMINFKF